MVEISRKMATEKFSMMRGGIVYRATDCGPTTVRNWPINIGDGSGEGHKRYDFVDVVSVQLMAELVFGQKISASRAAFIVNNSREQLHGAIVRYEYEKQETKHWRREGGPYLVAEGTRTDGSSGDRSQFAVLDDEQFASSWQDHISGSAIVVPLVPLINKVITALNLIFEYEDPFCSPDDEEN